MTDHRRQRAAPWQLTPRRPRPPRRRRGARRRRPPRSARRGCPDSAIAPPSRTTILPARRIVERRWAMTIAVRPASSRSSPRSITFSVRTSTFEVASSRIRIRGSASSARAKATKLPLPGAELDAALADLGLEPVRQRRDEVGRADRARPPPRSPPSRAAGRPKAMFSRTVPENRKPSWGTIPSCRRSASLLHPAQVVAVDQTPARAAGRRSARRASRTSTCPRPSPRPAPASGPAARAGRRPRSAHSTLAPSASRSSASSP